MITGKVIFVGSTDVGKTCLIRKFLDRNCDLTNVSATIWPSVFLCRLTTENGAVFLEVWDTAGQEKFRSVVQYYLQNVAAAVVVFDVTRSVTFAEAKTWANETSYNNVTSPSFILVGNKKDLWRRRVISREEAFSFARRIGASYLETSAKNYQNIYKIFMEATNEILKYQQNPMSTFKLMKHKNPEVFIQRNIF